jgi:lipoprotein-releasing system permease protein
VSFELNLAVKYFRAKKKSLARFTSFAAVAGIAAGVASLIFAQALSRGFSDEMRDKILANSAHVSVYSNAETEIENWREISESLKNNENITRITPTAFGSAILMSANSTNYAVLRAEGSANENVGEKNGEIWNFELRTVSIGAELAAKSGLKAGDIADIITIKTDDSTKQTTVRVEGVFRTGIYEYDSTQIIVSPKDFARFHDKRDFAPTHLNVSVKNIYESDAIAAQVRETLGENFRVIDWQEANRPLFAALSLERKVALAIISLIIFIAALNITTTLALLVNERRFDIAILRTCGARSRSLIMIFLLEGLFLAFIGIFSGVVLGLLACFLGNRFKLISLPAEVYSLSYIPLRPDFTNVSIIVFIAFILSLIATAYPAIRASRIKPMENLRNG